MALSCSGEIDGQYNAWRTVDNMLGNRSMPRCTVIPGYTCCLHPSTIRTASANITSKIFAGIGGLSRNLTPK